MIRSAGTHGEEAALGDTEEEADNKQACLVVDEALADGYDSPEKRKRGQPDLRVEQL